MEENTTATPENGTQPSARTPVTFTNDQNTPSSKARISAQSLIKRKSLLIIFSSLFLLVTTIVFTVYFLKPQQLRNTSTDIPQVEEKAQSLTFEKDKVYFNIKRRIIETLE